MTRDAAIRAPCLAALGMVDHAFFTRHGGVSEGIFASLNSGIGSGDDANRVRENRARMASMLDVPAARLLTAYQIHSAVVAIADAPWAIDDRPRADAIVTKSPGLAIGVSTADCGPVLFADPDAKVIGAAHAGWRGALTGVVEATVAHMERLGAQRRRLVAVLGPMIRQRNYEVGSELIERFVSSDPANKRFFAPAARVGHAMFDLAGFILARLVALDLAIVEDTGHCTYADEDRFYSFRRATHRGEKDYGRHIGAIALKP